MSKTPLNEENKELELEAQASETSASEVSEEDLEKVPNRSLGLVEGVSCQIKDTDAIATETDASWLMGVGVP